MSIKLLGDQAQKISRHSYFEQLASGILLSTKMAESRAHRGTHFWVLLTWYYTRNDLIATTIFSEAHLCNGCAGVSRNVSPDWSQKTMTCHSFNCFSIVWGQGWTPLVTSLPSSCYMTPLQCWNNIATIQNNIATTLQRCVALKIVVANRLA